MKRAVVADATLRVCDPVACTLGFKEKIEIVKHLDRLCVDVIETAPLLNGKSDVLLLHTLAPLTEKRVLSCAMPLDESLLEITVQAVSKAAHPRINVIAPVSTVQMEYHCHRKPEAVLEHIGSVVAAIKAAGIEVELSLADATRAEREFLAAAVTRGVEAGAKIVTICDSAGLMLPGELSDFISDLKANVPALSRAVLSVECSDELHMAPACAVACLRAGAEQIKTAVGVPGQLPLGSLADILRVKGAELKLTSGLNRTACEKLVREIEDAVSGRRPAALEKSAPAVPGHGDWKLSAADDMSVIGKAVKKLGYELSADDLVSVYNEFLRIARKKEVGPKDLDAIVATAAMQVPPTYTLKSFVINSGNIITSTAHVVMLKNGEEVQGFSMGDGPIDAAFLSIENMVGRHLELDDFQITAVTEGREAMGSSIVKLRSNGKLYSGKGISTDVIGAGIRAYVDALNKICYEENN
ncbi:MAG: hypothetical protein MR051_05730 [Lentisphaeria bacterium]|nr:hypothetical protein [Lentisphaeria bacterium]